jgi:Protein of unknown function (DUF4232)
MIRLFRTRRHVAVAAGVAAAAALAVVFAAPAAFSAPRSASATATTPQCGPADLGVWVAADQTSVAAGTAYYQLEFTNLSHHACTLYGFPGVSARASDAMILGSPARRDHAVRARTVRLSPGATGHALLEYSDVITGDCPSKHKVTAAFLWVYAPDQTVPNTALWSLPACTARGDKNFLRIRVIVGGIGVMGDRG